MELNYLITKFKIIPNLDENAEIFRKASRWLKSNEDGWTSTVIYQASW